MAPLTVCSLYSETPPHCSPNSVSSHQKMVSLEPIQTTPNPMIEPTSSPRISFSADLLDEADFISISPRSHRIKTEPRSQQDQPRSAAARNNQDFEFLSNIQTSPNAATMLTADELFSEGKLLPFWQMHNAEKLKNISIKTTVHQETEAIKETDNRGNWFVDDDPSPRPPNCTVLWKELLRLRKQRPSTLSPSSSTSSSSSSSSSSSNSGSKRVKNNGLERTRSGGSVRIRPMINVPICTQGGGRTSALPPLFPLKKGRLER